MEAPKKILIINKFCPLHPNAGGAEKHLLEISSRFGKEYEIYLLAAMFPGAKRDEIYQNIHILRFGQENSQNHIKIHFLLPLLTGKYLKILKPEMLIEDMSVIPFFTPILYPKQRKLIIAHHLNGLQFFQSQKFVYAIIGYLAEKLFLVLYKKECVVTVSEWMKQTLIRHKFKNIHKILNGIDEKLFQIKKQYSETPTVLFLGRLENRKGPDLFLNTYSIVKKIIPNVRYIIAGQTLENFEKTEGVDFLGRVSEEKKMELFSQTWLYVAPSRIEGYSISTIEANATGTFVVGNNVNGLTESIQNNQTGILTDCFDPQVFAQTIINNLDKNELIKKEEICRVWARKHNWQDSAEKIKKIIA